jgi:hypothetical protein
MLFAGSASESLMDNAKVEQPVPMEQAAMPQAPVQIPAAPAE